MLVYYGLSLGVSDLGGDLYLTQFMFGLVEIPARSLVLVLLPCSRRIPLSVFLAVGGGACLLTLTVPAGDHSNMARGTFSRICLFNYFLMKYFSLRQCSCSDCFGHGGEIWNYSIFCHHLYLFCRTIPNCSQVT